MNEDQHTTNNRHNLSERIAEMHQKQGTYCSAGAAMEKLSITKVYNAIRTKGTRVQWSNIIWDNKVAPKHSFITWIAARRKLATKDQITYRDTDPTCSLCNLASETSAHLFFSFPYTSTIWLKREETCSW